VPGPSARSGRSGRGAQHGRSGRPARAALAAALALAALASHDAQAADGLAPPPFAWPAWPDLRTLPREGYLHAARARSGASAGAGLGWRAAAVDCVEAGYRCSLRLEAEVAHWRSLNGQGDERSRITQVGLTPLWRQDLPRSTHRQWFVEFGTGINLIGPLYKTVEKRFSTSLNFGTQLAVGVAFGERREHELSLRLEHFSNAGLRSPNPGEDFVQLRYLKQL
jgi:hypothetical protein